MSLAIVTPIGSGKQEIDRMQLERLNSAAVVGNFDRGLNARYLLKDASRVLPRSSRCP